MTDSINYTPDTIKTEDIQAKIFKALEENGDLSDKEWRRLSLLSDAGLYSMLLKLQPLIKRVEVLEKVNIILWIKNNKKSAWVIFWAMVIFASFIHEIIPFVTNIFVQASKFIP